MKTGIIGLPQVGKTSLFKILTKAKVEEKAFSREAHIGIAGNPANRACTYERKLHLVVRAWARRSHAVA